MADTGIEWTRGDDGSAGKVWNPTTGCDRISPGCDHCYALTMAKRLKGMGSAKYQTDGDPRTSGPGFGITVHPETLRDPFHWRKPARVFVNSMSDLFHARVPESFVGGVWDTMAQTERHTYQILTKRPERMRRTLARWEAAGWTWRRHDLLWCGPVPGPLPNVWCGTSIESADYLRRADDLRETPAAVRFLSLEPLLGPLPTLDLTGIGWVIAGGESGPGARRCEPGWIEDIVNQCRAAQVPVFVKQLGSVTGREMGAGSHGADWSAWPAGLRVREFPAVREAAA